MRSMSSSTFHVSSIGMLTRNSSVDLHLDPPLTPRSREVVGGVDVGRLAGAVARSTSVTAWRRMSTRAPVVAVERERLGPSDAPEQHRVRPHARRTSRPRARRRRRAPPPARRYASAPTQRLIGEPDAHARRPGRRARPAPSGRLQARRRCRGSGGARCATTSHASVAARGHVAARVTDDEHHRTRARDAVRGGDAPTTRAAGRATRASGLGTSPPKRTPRPAASTATAARRVKPTPPRAPAARAPGRGARGTRRPRSGRRAARCPRRRAAAASADRRAARPAPASTAARPQRRRAHVDERRRGCVPLARTATAPTIAQSWARRLNFWYDEAVRPVFGTRISVSSSSGCERGLEEALEELGGRRSVRSPEAPGRRRSASSASSAAGRSDAGSPCATEPPIVPRWRTWLSPTCGRDRPEHAAARVVEQRRRSRGRGGG